MNGLRLGRILGLFCADDTAAALRPLKILEECRQMGAADSERWRRRIEEWAQFDAPEIEVAASV